MQRAWKGLRNQGTISNSLLVACFLSWIKFSGAERVRVSGQMAGTWKKRKTLRIPRVSWRWPVHMFFGRSVTVLGSIENSCESPMKLVFRSSKITGGVDIGFAKNEPWSSIKMQKNSSSIRKICSSPSGSKNISIDYIDSTIYQSHPPFILNTPILWFQISGFIPYIHHGFWGCAKNIESQIQKKLFLMVKSYTLPVT